MYMEEAVLQEMQSSKSFQDNSNSLVSALVKANQEEKNQEHSDGGSRRSSYLSDRELYGNIFVFNLAGYETTASTMTFALPFLAAYPEVQEWVRQEVDVHFTGKQANTTSSDDTFPSMVRCLALMYEVLRIASHAPQMVRMASTPETLPISATQSIIVPASTHVSAHFYHVHLNPHTWGADAHEFIPRRWISVDPSTAAETLHGPPPGAGYLAWLTGPRVCPGKKFSQVEFVAVIAQLLSGHRVEPLGMLPGDTSAAIARENLLRVIDDKYFHIAAKLRRPGDAGVKIVER